MQRSSPSFDAAVNIGLGYAKEKGGSFFNPVPVSSVKRMEVQ